MRLGALKHSLAKLLLSLLIQRLNPRVEGLLAFFGIRFAELGRFFLIVRVHCGAFFRVFRAILCWKKPTAAESKACHKQEDAEWAETLLSTREVGKQSAKRCTSILIAAPENQRKEQNYYNALNLCRIMRFIGWPPFQRGMPRKCAY